MKKLKSLAEKLDKADTLAGYQKKFHFPKQKGKRVAYFCGNSLGLMPKTAEGYVLQELKDWQKHGVEGHFKAKRPWFGYHHQLTHMAANLVGAQPEEVVVMNNLTTNLHLLMVSFYRPTKTRYKILMEAGAFPSDQYAMESQVRWHGLDPAKTIVELKPRPGEHTLHTQDTLETIHKHRNSLALVMMGGVNYYTGQAFEMDKITEAAHQAGSLAGFDLAHAAGNLPLHLHRWNVDFAAWCSYKYLNSGPGGTSGVFIHRRHATNKSLPRFAGWWGHNEKERFNMRPGFDPIPTAEGWQLSNAQILPMALHLASLKIFAEAGMEKLRKKSLLLTGLLATGLDQLQLPQLKVITPADPHHRGCQLSILTGSDGRSLHSHLTKKGIVADWREPNVIRVAPVPLYNSFADVYRLCDEINNFYRKG